jgi:CBS domain-containing protein
MLAKDAEPEIVRNQDPLVLPWNTTVVKAARLMDNQSVSAVLVTEEDATLVGIFTGRDAVARVLARGRDPVITTLGQVMTTNPIVMTPRHTAMEALRLMQDAHCRHLPVVDGGKVVGLVSRGDFRGVEQERLDEETGP